MKYDPALRWWSILAVAIASFSMPQMLGELDAKAFAQEMSSECGLPSFSQSFLPLIDSFGIYGTALAVLIILTAVVGFRVLRTEEARYRLATIVHVVTWPIVLLGVAIFFLAAYALPYAKCAAAAS